MKTVMILTCVLTSIILVKAGYIVLPNDQANKKSDDESKITKNYKNENPKQVISEKGEETEYYSQNEENEDKIYENTMSLNKETWKINVTKYKFATPKTFDSMKETDHKTITKDTYLKHDGTEVDADTREISYIITNVCGEQYEPCKKTNVGFRFFKESSICLMCSCIATTCHTSKNCCPDVLVNINDTKDNETPNEPCMTLHDVLTFKDPNEEPKHHTVYNSSTKDNYNYTEHPNLNNLKSINESVPQQELEALKLNSKLATTYFPKYFVINSCPKNYNDSEIIAKCVDTRSPFLLDNLPVTYWFTMNIYRNKWCAKCHNISDTDNWILVTDCLQLYNMYYLPSQISKFHELTKNCTVRVIPTIGPKTDYKTCETSIQQHVFDKCNITGLWNPTYANTTTSMIQTLCEQRHFMPLYKELTNGQIGVYKNMFCYMCNRNEDMQKMKEKSVPDEDSLYGKIRLYKSIHCADGTTETEIWPKVGNNLNQTCPYGMIPDIYTDECIPFECPLHQMAMSNLCFDRYTDVTGLVIASTVHLTFQNPVFLGISEDEKHKFGKEVADAIDNKLLISKSGCDIRAVKLLANYTLTNEGYVQEVFLVYKIANTKICSVKQVVEIYTKLYRGDIKIFVHLAGSDALLQHPKSYETFNVTLSFSIVQNFDTEFFLKQMPVSYEIWLTVNFQCPRVLLPPSYFGKLSRKRQLNPLRSPFFQAHNATQIETISVCYLEFLQDWLHEMYTDSPKTGQQANHNTLTATLSMISTITSMLSIVFVLITYTIFSDLRFIPGKLFMVLCFNLLLAQGFYSFGFDLGVDNIWCQIVGVCIHLLWITTIFLMTSCLWLMLKNIKDPLGAENRYLIQSRSNFLVLKYTSYSYCMSVLCVLTNIIISHLVNHDDHYGYGGKFCYINTAEMRLITFAFPIAVVLIVNFIMFFFIMSKISKMMTVTRSADLKERVIVFLKLSTITGFYWTFGFIYEATKIGIFEYLFIIMNGGQGFFLMWSFLFNKRIFEMYKDIFKKLTEKYVSISD